MNKEEIMSILPHRDSMLLIEEVEQRDGKAYGSYTVRGDEWFLDGHFPGNPIVPGVILCEIMAQSACVLIDGGIAPDESPYFAGISSARFKSPVKPGDKAETECSLTKVKKPFYFAAGELRVGGRLCVKADFSFVLVKGG